LAELIQAQSHANPGSRSTGNIKINIKGRDQKAKKSGKP
jgi:hypothetical protein